MSIANLQVAVYLYVIDIAISKALIWILFWVLDLVLAFSRAYG
jgi:hypothetical protein